MINITFPDGSVRAYESGITAYEIANGISPRLAADVMAATVITKDDTTGKGTIYDLDRPINEDASIRLHKWEDAEAKHVFWHSSSHLLAAALEALYPGVKFGIGPAIETGFYYDVDFGERTLVEADLKAIENKMMELARQKNAFVRTEVSKAEALRTFTEKGDEYKCELINDLEDGTITFYTNGAFTDLCRGPHLRDTSVIKAVKLTAIAGAYWRGDQDRKMLTRVYGVSFPKKSLLDEYLQMMEEAKKRDHRKIGKEMELFTFSQRVGQGLPLWLPKGAALRERLENFLKKLQKSYGYLPVITPHIGNKDLYVTSGHYAKYGKDSFQPIHTPQEGEEYLLKPMNCPHHCEIYRSKPRSYKDLPLRLAEFGTVYRYEQSGELHGLTRVRSFTQDDAHLFCRPDQLKEEFCKVIDIILYVFSFATTLVIGILTSLFCSIFITRLLIEAIVAKWGKISFSYKWSENLLANFHFDFIGKRKWAYLTSGVIILAGVASLVFHGLNYGVEFTGGRTFVVRFDKNVSAEDVRHALGGSFVDGDAAKTSFEVKQYGKENQMRIVTQYKYDDTSEATTEEVETILYNALKPLYGYDITLDGFRSTQDDQNGIVSADKIGPAIAK